jgi:hypothetical protein
VAAAAAAAQVIDLVEMQAVSAVVLRFPGAGAAALDLFDAGAAWKRFATSRESRAPA